MKSKDATFLLSPRLEKKRKISLKNIRDGYNPGGRNDTQKKKIIMFKCCVNRDVRADNFQFEDSLMRKAFSQTMPDLSFRSATGLQVGRQQQVEIRNNKQTSAGRLLTPLECSIAKL